MPRFRKKPVVIDAVRWNGRTDWSEIVDLAGDQIEHVGLGLDEFAERLAINTLEGRMWANPGDWIIKGVNGELYPCKPDIFEKTYEPAEGEQ
jgi:hypothetical protein